MTRQDWRDFLLALPVAALGLVVLWAFCVLMIVTVG
jgi:hypothetical protein